MFLLRVCIPSIIRSLHFQIQWCKKVFETSLRVTIDQEIHVVHISRSTDLFNDNISEIDSTVLPFLFVKKLPKNILIFVSFLDDNDKNDLLYTSTVQR